jgi:hypothetical protein
MRKLGDLVAQPPISPHPNLTAIARAGSKHKDPIWQVACTCGKTFQSVARALRIGETKCTRCQPSIGDAQAMEILMLLPATYDVLVKKTGTTIPTVKNRIRAMRKHNFCHTGKWQRSKRGGDFQPVIVAGPGEDAPCELQARTHAAYKRKYKRRVKRAIEQAENSGKEDPRYSRQISLHKANETARRTLTEPQGPWAALFAVRLPLNAEG